MSLSNNRLKNSLQHNLDLLDQIYASGLSMYYNTDVIHDAIDSICIELRRCGIKI